MSISWPTGPKKRTPSGPRCPAWTVTWRSSSNSSRSKWTKCWPSSATSANHCSAPARHRRPRRPPVPQPARRRRQRHQRPRYRPTSRHRSKPPAVNWTPSTPKWRHCLKCPRKWTRSVFSFFFLFFFFFWLVSLVFSTDSLGFTSRCGTFWWVPRARSMNWCRPKRRCCGRRSGSSGPSATSSPTSTSKSSRSSRTWTLLCNSNNGRRTTVKSTPPPNQFWVLYISLLRTIPASGFRYDPQVQGIFSSRSKVWLRLPSFIQCQVFFSIAISMWGRGPIASIWSIVGP